MKLLFIIPSLSIGGLEREQVTIANALADRGYDVTVLTLDANWSLKNLLDSRVNLCYKPYRPTMLRKLPYVKHRLFDDGMWETRMSPQALHRYYVGNAHFDVEIAFFRGLPVKIVSGAPRFLHKNAKRVQLLAWVHSDFRKATGFSNNFKSDSQVFQAYRRFDKVVCVSKQAEESFKAVIGDTGNTTTIYNMLPIKKIQQDAMEACPIPVVRHAKNLVLVGRLLDKAKGQIRLISVVKALQNEGLDVGLVLVGDGPDRQKIEDTIRDYAASDYVQLVGMQKNPYPYIKAADLLVCASYYEGYNLTVAEALICGTPVLSTDCTGPREILDGGKYGMLVENTERGLYKGLKALACSPDLLQHYRNEGKARTCFFDDNKIIAQIEALL